MQNRKSKLDIHFYEIKELLFLEVPKTAIAKKFGVNRNTLTNWLIKNKLQKIKSR